MKNLFKLQIIVLLLLGFIYAQNPNQTLTDSLQKRIDNVFSKYGVPGGTLAVAMPDGSFINISTGYADLESKTKMKPEDLMFGGSTGKFFAAPVVMQLCDEKKLSFDDKAIKFFEKDEWFKRIPNYDKITIRNLLNHTTGIPEYIIKETFGKDIVAQPDKVWKPEELLSYIFDKPALFEAGKGWGYADANYIILGIIIEKVSGNGYYDELKNRVLIPNKLNRTFPSTSRRLAGLVSGYSDDNPYLVAPVKTVENGYCFVNPQFEFTGGGLVTNPVDLAKWGKKFWRGDAFSKELNDEMKKVVDTRTGQPAQAGYGFALFKYPTQRNGNIYTHGGIMFGYLTEVFYFEEYDFCIAAQINADVFYKGLQKPLTPMMAEIYSVVINYLKDNKKQN